MALVLAQNGQVLTAAEKIGKKSGIGRNTISNYKQLLPLLKNPIARFESGGSFYLSKKRKEVMPMRVSG